MMTGKTIRRGQDQVLHMTGGARDTTEEVIGKEIINKDDSDPDQDPGPYLHDMIDSGQQGDDLVLLQT